VEGEAVLWKPSSGDPCRVASGLPDDPSTLDSLNDLDEVDDTIGNFLTYIHKSNLNYEEGLNYEELKMNTKKCLSPVLWVAGSGSGGGRGSTVETLFRGPLEGCVRVAG
jgi:hypothetical protein